MVVVVFLEYKGKCKKGKRSGKYEAISEWIYLYGFLFNYFVMMLISCIVDYSNDFDIVEYIFVKGVWWQCALACLIGYLPGSWVFDRFLAPFVRRHYLENYLLKKGILINEVTKIQHVITLCKQLGYIPLTGDKNYGKLIGDSFQIKCLKTYLELTCLLDISGHNILDVAIDPKCDLSNYADISQWTNDDKYVFYFLCIVIPCEGGMEKDIYAKLLKGRLRDSGYKIKGDEIYF